MKNWSSALFPLSVMLVLTALTFWLRYVTELPEARRDGKHRHDPDYVVTDSALRKFDVNGRLKYTLNAAEIRHYPDDDSTELAKPHLVYQAVKKPQLTMSAERGRVSQDNERVDLEGNVQIRRAASGKYAELVAVTPTLTVLPDDERAFTRSPVLITQGNSWIKGVGLQVNHRTQTYLLESQARAEMESKTTRNRK